MKTLIVSLMAIFCLQLAYAQKKERIVIRGYIEDPKIVDSITMVIWDHYYGDSKRYQLTRKLTKLRLNSPAGYFEFIDTISGPVYLTIGQKYNHFGHIGDGVLNKYIAEPGDSITIVNFGGKNTVFYGRGKDKYECRYALDRNTVFQNSNTIDTTGQHLIINQYKSRLSPFIYEVLRTDIIGKSLERITPDVSTAWARKDTLKLNKVLPKYNQLLNQIGSVSESAKIFSSMYAYTMITSAAFENQQSGDTKGTYAILKKRYKGQLREKVLTGYMVLFFEKMKNADSLLEDAIQVVKHPDYLAVLNTIQDTHAKGKPAFNFTLSDEQGQTKRLSDFKGKVVFIDFWFTGCVACILYHKEVLSPIIQDYRNNKDIVFLTINIDDTRERWLNSIKSGEYTSPGSINLYTNGEATNHEVIRHYKVISYPRPLLIDKKGRIFATSVFDLRLDPAKFKQTLEEALAQ